MGEILTDADRKEVVDRLSILYPTFNAALIEDLLGAEDYNVKATESYLKRFSGCTDGEHGKAQFVVSDHAASIPTKYRSASQSGLIVSSVHSRSLTDPSESDENALEDDSLVVSGARVRVHFSPEDGEAPGPGTSEQSESSSPREDDCDEEKFTGSRPAKGKTDVHGSASKAVNKNGRTKPLAAKKTSCPVLLPSIYAGAYRNTFVVRTVESAAPTGSRSVEMPRLNVCRPPTRSTPRVQPNTIVVEQLFASRDGIRGHLAASELANSRQTTPRQTTTTTGTGTGTGTSLVAKLHFVNMNLPARYNRDQKTPAKTHAPKTPTQRPPLTPATAKSPSGVATKSTSATTRKAKTDLHPPTRSFLKQNATRTPASAEPKRAVKTGTPKVQPATLQPTRELELNEIRLPSAKSTARSAYVSQSREDDEEYEEIEEDLSGLPSDDESSPSPSPAMRLDSLAVTGTGTSTSTSSDSNPVHFGANNVDLGDLVWKAVRRGSSALAEDVPPERPGNVQTQTQTQAAQSGTGAMQGYELVGTGSPIKYKRGKLLGKGAFGRVYLAFTDKGQLIAVKEIEINLPPNYKQLLANGDQPLDPAQRRFEKEYNTVEREIDILRNIRHQNTVQFLGVYREGVTNGDESFKIFIFTEYISGDTVANLLRQFGPFTEPITRHYVAQILSGIIFLHSLNVIHRDLKGQNIMVDKLGLVKLIDFGSAKTLVQQAADSTIESEPSSRQSTLKFDDRWAHAEQANPSDSSKHHSVIGSPYWMAPEVIKQAGHSYKSDCWSLGCTVFEMATGNPPWHTLHPLTAMWHIAGDGDVPRLRLHAPQFSSEADDFVTHCLQRDVRVRFDAKKLQNCAFVTAGDV